MNHSFRNAAKHLVEAGMMKGRGFLHLKEVVRKSGLRLRMEIMKAIIFRRNAVHVNNKSENMETSHLMEEVANMAYHVFGNHSRCKDFHRFCSGQP